MSTIVRLRTAPKIDLMNFETMINTKCRCDFNDIQSGKVVTMKEYYSSSSDSIEIDLEKHKTTIHIKCDLQQR